LQSGISVFYNGADAMDENKVLKGLTSKELERLYDLAGIDKQTLCLIMLQRILIKDQLPLAGVIAGVGRSGCESRTQARQD
jgi:hypothetical protein